MATTCFFEETISDLQKKDAKIELEFGRSSYYGKNLMYFTINGESVIVDEETGRKIAVQMESLAAYLGYHR
ncbi:hypothetical protein [Bradyrhizobium ganzhouense]|uniref:hypothetical protein n=1 Tax=Bradyrhizobium ganzhouense TaxID=1179767 RepID=UPI003CE75CB8